VAEQKFNFDNYAPAEMERKAKAAGVAKVKLSFLSLSILSILAGIFIALGAEFCTLVIFDSNLSIGLTKLLGGIAFSLGLILVVIGGAELFTGNNMIMVGFASRVVTFKQLLRNWSVSYLGNFIGAMIVVFIIFLTNQWKMGDYMLGAKAVLIAANKVNLTFLEAFSRAILCNMLVCLAIWMCFSARTVVSKIAAIIFPITAFVASGFEHSIANMYFIPMGILLKQNESVANAVLKIAPDTSLERLNVMGFLGNLLPVTIGNIIGGAIMICLVYWLAVEFPKRLKKKKL